MGFQILNADKTPIAINDLDKEAADFWKMPVHPRWYVAPYESGNNWFDSIGYAIHNPDNYTKGWDNVKCTLYNCHTGDLAMLTFDQQVERLKRTNEFLMPYFYLIDHWESKGYTPLKVE